MHVVTFYSFKGGVGRTLALVNIGIELAKTGRKVLLVDFDLEAPGIDTFNELEPPKSTPGVVDYIADYLSSNRPPDFQEFYYQPKSTKSYDGQLWVMPAGRRNSSYASKLGSIDWQDLYDEREGFLLMENLKRQWEKTLEPDYVLIDSRTGHTEVGGICTRQLPNTVVVMFIPNEQNLTGVSSVVDAIKEENESSRNRINIELVASNVPSLDDEHEILRKMMRKFERRLVSSERKPLRSHFTTINRYDSMHLLDQTVFISERPRSRLAKQYRTLLRKIVAHNLDDREAALRVISQRFPHPSRRDRFAATDFEQFESLDDHQTVQDILNRHPNDAEIFHMVGQLYKGKGELDEAEFFFSRASKLGEINKDSKIAKYQLELYETQANLGNHDAVTEDVLNLLSNELKGPELRQAIGLLIKVDENPPAELFSHGALSNLSVEDIESVAWQLSTSRAWQKFGADILEKADRTVAFEAIENDVDLVLLCIGAQRYDFVLDAIQLDEMLNENEISSCFNYAMAKWAYDSEPDRNLFRHVIEIDALEPLSAGANYEQCLSIAAFLADEKELAKSRLEKARALADDFILQAFSCWRYLLVNRNDFISDLDEVYGLINGKELLPQFMRQ